jgi:hypothetical protein
MTPYDPAIQRSGDHAITRSRFRGIVYVPIGAVEEHVVSASERWAMGDRSERWAVRQSDHSSLKVD